MAFSIDDRFRRAKTPFHRSKPGTRRFYLHVKKTTSKFVAKLKNHENSFG